MNCVECGNTGLVSVEKGPAGATYTVLARCKCQPGEVRVARAQYEALMAAAGTLESEHDFVDSEVDTCPWCRAIAALRAAGIKSGGTDG